MRFSQRVKNEDEPTIIYPSMGYVADQLKVTVGAIEYAMKTGKRVGGLKLARTEESPTVGLEHERVHKTRSDARPIIVGKIEHPSVYAALRALALPKSAYHNVTSAADKQGTVKGLRVRWPDVAAEHPESEDGEPSIEEAMPPKAKTQAQPDAIGRAMSRMFSSLRASRRSS